MNKQSFSYFSFLVSTQFVSVQFPRLAIEDFLNAQKEMKEELAEMKNKQEQIDSGLEMSNSKLNEEIKKRKKE